MDTSDLLAFLAGHRLAVLASVAEADQPEAALVGIAVTPALELVFDTVRSSRKYRNLQQRSKVAAVIGWDDERTVQYEGIARELQGEELAAYQTIYFTAFPEGRARLGWPGICYFCIEPRWIRFSDCTGKQETAEFTRVGGELLRTLPTP